MKYEEFKNYYQERINELPLKFAFSDKQFKEAMESLGLSENDTDKIVSIGAGGFCTKETADKLSNLMKERHQKQEELFNNDDFLQSAFEYELGNHEYICTYELYETLYALGISEQDYYNNERYQNIMKKAKNNYLKEMEKYGY